jgi:uncharacterized protein YecT (DUF1311 family)
MIDQKEFVMKPDDSYDSYDSRRNRNLRMAVAVMLLAFFCLFLTSPQAAVEEKHSIDAWLEDAYAKEETTAGQREVINQAREMWDREMNRAYKKLIGSLSPKQQATLKKSQENWLKFQDSEWEVISSVVAGKEGTMWQLTATEKGMEFVRQRALQLLAYESILDQ